MEILDYTAAGGLVDEFFDRLSRSEKSALMLDYDGTLAPFVVDRARAVPYPGVRGAVDALMEAGCMVVVVSGRAVEDLLPLMGFTRTPEVWGSHGWERLHADGALVRTDVGPLAAEALGEAALWAYANGHAGKVETKPASVALHTRGLTPVQADRLAREAEAAFTAVAVKAGLEVRSFDGGVEIRPVGKGKALAVETVLDELGPEAVAAYLGDDDTDEDAFRAMKGRGLGVLVRDDPRASAASVRITPPLELLDFLGRWLVNCGGM